MTWFGRPKFLGNNFYPQEIMFLFTNIVIFVGKKRLRNRPRKTSNEESKKKITLDVKILISKCVLPSSGAFEMFTPWKRQTKTFRGKH